MHGRTSFSFETLPQSIEIAPLTQALTAACAQLSTAGTVALKFLPRLRQLDERPACLFDPCSGTIVFSGAQRNMPAADASRLLRSLLGDGYPVRKLLAPERIAVEAVGIILQERRVRILHESRRRLCHAAAMLSRRRAVAGAPRRADAADFAQLARLAAADAPPAWSGSPDAEAWTRSDTDYLRRAVAEGRCYFWETAHPVSWAIVGPRSADSYEIVSVGTEPGSRRRGFAGALLAHLAGTMTPLTPILFVERGNLPAEALYRRLRFTPGGWWRCVLFDPIAAGP